MPWCPGVSLALQQVVACSFRAQLSDMLLTYVALLVCSAATTEAAAAPAGKAKSGGKVAPPAAGTRRGLRSAAIKA